MVLGAGEMQIPIIKKIKEQGYESIVLDYNKYAAGFKYSDKHYLVSSTDEKGVFNVAQKEEIDAILTTSDYPVNIVAAVSEKMRLLSMSQKVANICTNKYIQRKLFSENGITTPKFYLISEGEFNPKYFKDFPYIVKPVDSSASRGVKKVENEIDLMKAIQEAKDFSRSGQVLIEQYIGGKEFSVETLTQNNETSVVNITEKLVIGKNYGYFVEDTHIQPARISSDEWSLIEHEVINALSLIEANNCPSHTEVKIWNNKVYIIEMACRLGGDYITSDLVPLSTGIDMLSNLIKLSIGEPIDRVRKIKKVSCVQFLNHQNYKRCIDIIKNKNPHIVRYEVKPYSHKRIENSLDRLGYIILRCNDYRELSAILGQIR